MLGPICLGVKRFCDLSYSGILHFQSPCLIFQEKFEEIIDINGLNLIDDLINLDIIKYKLKDIDYLWIHDFLIN